MLWWPRPWHLSTDPRGQCFLKINYIYTDRVSIDICSGAAATRTAASMKQALVRHAHKHTPGVQADRAAQTARGTAHGPVAHNLEARMGCRVERHWRLEPKAPASGLSQAPRTHEGRKPGAKIAAASASTVSLPTPSSTCAVTATGTGHYYGARPAA